LDAPQLADVQKVNKDACLEISGPDRKEGKWISSNERHMYVDALACVEYHTVSPLTVNSDDDFSVTFSITNQTQETESCTTYMAYLKNSEKDDFEEYQKDNANKTLADFV
jgi:hypothetical protein